jgi:hypothetical protein
MVIKKLQIFKHFRSHAFGLGCFACIWSVQMWYVLYAKHTRKSTKAGTWEPQEGGSRVVGNWVSSVFVRDQGGNIGLSFC